MAERRLTSNSRDTRELGTEIVEAVASEKGRDPLDLPPLHDAIDPAALERLFAPTATGRTRDGRVRFAYCDCTVHVGRNGQVRVGPTDGP